MEVCKFNSVLDRFCCSRSNRSCFDELRYVIIRIARLCVRYNQATENSDILMLAGRINGMCFALNIIWLGLNIFVNFDAFGHICSLEFLGLQFDFEEVAKL